MPLLQHRAHCAVEHKNALGEQLSQRSGRFFQVLHPLEGDNSSRGKSRTACSPTPGWPPARLLPLLYAVLTLEANDLRREETARLARYRLSLATSLLRAQFTLTGTGVQWRLQHGGMRPCASPSLDVDMSAW